MDLLKKELERKKKALKGAAAAAAVKGTTSSSRRFLQVGALRRIQEEQEEAERSKRKSESRNDVDKSVKKRRTDAGGDGDGEVKSLKASTTIQPKGQSREQDEPSQKSDGENVRKAGHAKSSTDELSFVEVTRELRLLSLPVRLFGEIDAARRERLCQARKAQNETLLTIKEKDEFRLGKGHGIRNPFLEKEDQQEAKTSKNKKDDAGKEKLSEEDTNDPHKRIYRYFKDLLREWEDDLTKRPEEVKRTVAGRNETKTLKQCKDYVRPLFKLCKTRKLEEGLMASFLKIVEFCIEGDFVKAHDVYMDVAIGRAAWPIGVTMVGIHARTGRAKIESQNVAHVMNSELQRKYLTSVKRLMTFAQNKRTDVNPSKKVR
jgi:pre-mRNA-splicing factor 18